MRTYRSARLIPNDYQNKLQEAMKETKNTERLTKVLAALRDWGPMHLERIAHKVAQAGDSIFLAEHPRVLEETLDLLIKHGLVISYMHTERKGCT